MASSSRFSRRDLCRIGFLGIPFASLLTHALASMDAVAGDNKAGSAAKKGGAPADPKGAATDKPAADGAAPKCPDGTKLVDITTNAAANGFGYKSPSTDPAKLCVDCAQYNKKLACTLQGKAVAPCNLIGGAFVEGPGTCNLFVKRPPA